jgi:hypothetical protein
LEKPGHDRGDDSNPHQAGGDADDEQFREMHGEAQGPLDIAEGAGNQAISGT